MRYLRAHYHGAMNGSHPFAGGPKCWDGSGAALSGPPASFTSIRFQVAADAVYGINIDFGFCVTKLSL